MRQHCIAVAIAMAFPAPFVAAATSATPAQVSDEQARDLGVTIVSRTQPTSLPTQIPTTLEGVTREQIEQTINATDSEDALKYLPSLLVRKRYIGDYNHAILSTRASGTGNSARSMVFADGILLSNLLGNGVGGLSYPPRWNLVTPEEIDRVDVMYGPFSAAYPGNSVGAVVDYVTRMPTRLESHFQVGVVDQPFELYNTKDHFRAWQTSASVGNRQGDWSWWLNLNHTDSDGQPQTYATRLRSSAQSTTSGTVVTGAVLDRNNANAPWYVIGSGTQYHTVQDHLKVKLAYDISPTVRAAYTLGLWQNTSDGRATSYLKDSAGNPVTRGVVNIDGRDYAALTGTDFTQSQQESLHYMHGLSVKSRTKGTWDWEVAASVYDYSRDELRQSTGNLVDGSSSGWHSLVGKGTWRPEGMQGEHIVDFGAQFDQYHLRLRTSSVPTATWESSAPTASSNFVRGSTRTTSVWAQDAWRVAPRWKAVLGLRAEHWEAQQGLTEFAAPIAPVAHPGRSENALSPKAAVSWQWRDDTVLKASLGRAVRFPTASELYGGTSATSSNSVYVNDPNLKAEKSWTAELTADTTWGEDQLRVTLFAEDTRDGLFSQSAPDPSNPSRNISRVQNVSHLTTQGVELAWQAKSVGWKALDLQSSLTYTDSLIVSNDNGYVSTPGDTVGKQQPNVPTWRASALGSYRFNDQWTGALGARYSGPQFRTLNNADVYGYTYQGVSEYFVVDLKASWKFSRQWTASFGIDNLNNNKHWNFHPYPQRAWYANLKGDF